MVRGILRSLVTPKVIGAVLSLAIAAGGAMYIINLLEDRGRLQTQLEQANVELANQQLALENQRKRFEQTIANYDDVMSEYLGKIVESDRRARSLRGTIDRLSRENDALQQCFNMEAPDELLDGLFGEEQ